MPIKVDNFDALGKFYGALTDTANNLGLSQLWLVGINKTDLNSIANIINQDINQYEGNNNKWDIQGSLPEAYNSSWFIGDTYYLYAQSAVFPGDGISVSRQGSDKTGALKGLVSEQRNDLPTVTITFLETNQSVADVLFRPWSILAGFKSLKNANIRIPIKLVCFQKDGPVDSLKIRKEINLVRAVPITIDSEEYNYTGDKVIYRQIEFVYDKYYVVAQNLTMPIDSVSWGKGNYSEWAYKKVLNYPRSEMILDELPIDDLEKDPKFKEKLKAATNIDIGYQIDADTGSQDRKNPVDSFLDSIENIIETAAGIYTTVEGKVDEIQSETVRILRSVGLDHAANEVDEAFERAENSVLQPIGDVIGTGVEVIGGIEAARRLGRDVASIGDPNSGQVWTGEIDMPDADPTKPLPEIPDKQQLSKPIVKLPEAQNKTLITADEFIKNNSNQEQLQNQQNVTDNNFNNNQNSVNTEKANIIGTGEVVPNNISQTNKQIGRADIVVNNQLTMVKQPIPKLKPSIPNVEIK